MTTVSVDTDDPGLREELHQLVVSCRRDALPPDVASLKVINLLKTYAHFTQGEVTAEEVNYYISSLIEWITKTIKSQDPKGIEAICSLWDGEDWKSIQEKLLTDGSTWHVWWMDGVRKYIAIDRGWLPKGSVSG